MVCSTECVRRLAFGVANDLHITMNIPKPTDEQKQRFHDVVPSDPRVTVKPMFGNLGAYVSLVMFAGTFGPDIGVKLNDSDREELIAAGGGPFGPPERPMGGYTTIPEMNDDSVAAWLERAVSHVAQLPPKKPRVPKKPTSK
jgi:TfoX/Sxy family transcriptional regulator of competence genes